MLIGYQKSTKKFVLTSPQAYFMPQLKGEGGELLLGHENNICDNTDGL